MLRPLYLDVCDVLLPLGVALAALAAGRSLHLLPTAFFRGAIGVAGLIVLILAGSYLVPLPEPVNVALWQLGGEGPIACVLAMLLLGVVWSSRGRSSSTGFLRTLVGLIVLILILTTGGRLWWRNFSPQAWDNTPNSAGVLAQTTGWTCGPAAAALLLHHHGVKTSEGEIAYFAGTSFLGTNTRSLAHAITLKGQERGLSARLVDADYDAALEQPAPLIACVTVPKIGSHAVFVLRMTPEVVELIDPRFGQRQIIPRTEMQALWEGKIVLVEPAK
jgi:hypothetical protein